EAHAAAEARRNADRAADIRAVRDGHHARDHRRHAAPGRAARRVAVAPGVRDIAVERALGGARHGVLGRGAAPDDVEPRRTEELRDVRVLPAHHALAQPAAELDLPARLVA